MKIYQVADKIKRYWRQFRILSIRDGWKKASYLKKHNIFHYIGENVYYTSNILPAEPFLVALHDNIVVAAGVRLVTHSVEHVIFNLEENTNKYLCKYGKIEIHSNVYIGADVIINPGITIGKNCIIGAGSIVTRDVPENSVVAGIPAKIIGTYDEVKRKSKVYSDKFGDIGDRRWVVDLMKICPVEFDIDKEN